MTKLEEIKARLAGAKAPSARRKWSGGYAKGRENALKRGSYREYMLRVAQKYSSVEKADAAFAKTPFGEAGYKIAWPFLVREGYVIFNDAH